MAHEIERKFLVQADKWSTDGLDGTLFIQGYLSVDAGRTVRVRTEGDRGVLTIKGMTIGITRPEYEYEIPLSDARELLAMCIHPPLRKVRYRVAVQGSEWEVDVFEAENSGLIVAEVELASEATPFSRPAWLGDEVSGDRRYANAALSVTPFRAWSPDL